MESPEHDQDQLRPEGKMWELQGRSAVSHLDQGVATVACDKARARQGLLVRPDEIWSVGKLGSPCRHTRWYEPSWQRQRQRSHYTRKQIHAHTQYTVDTDTTGANEQSLRRVIPTVRCHLQWMVAFLFWVSGLEGSRATHRQYFVRCCVASPVPWLCSGQWGATTGFQRVGDQPLSSVLQRVVDPY